MLFWRDGFDGLIKFEDVDGVFIRGAGEELGGPMEANMQDDCRLSSSSQFLELLSGSGVVYPNGSAFTGSRGHQGALVVER